MTRCDNAARDKDGTIIIANAACCRRPAFTIGSNVYLSSLRFILFPAQLSRRATLRENANLGDIASISAQRGERGPTSHIAARLCVLFRAPRLRYY